MSVSFVFPELPPREVLIFSISTGTIIFSILAAIFCPFMAVVSDFLAAARGRAFFAKAARQTAQLGLLLNSVLFLCLGGAATFVLKGQPELLEAPYRLPLMSIAGAALGTELFLVVHAFWGKERGISHAVRAAAGFLAWLGAMLTMYLGLGFLRRISHTAPDMQQFASNIQELTAFFTIPLHSLFWPLLAEGAALGVAAASAAATVWLLLVRTRQDYGRDYYNFALRYFCGWAICACLLSLPLAVYASYHALMMMLPELSHTPSWPLLLASAVMPLAACVFWYATIRSTTPLRHKVGILIAFVCFYSALLGQVLIFNKILPSP